jgi:hydroxyacylglutathione hydrolase
MQITSHLHALKIPFVVATPQGAVPRYVYVYLVYGDEVCLIDSGVASSQKIIFDYMMKTARHPEEISLLILTHSHPDHMGAARSIKEATGCSVAAHRNEKTWIEDAELQARERPVPGFFSLVEGSVKVDRCLQEGDVFDLGGIGRLCVLHTPGHSPGSISLWLPEDEALISADAVPVPGELPIYEDFQQSAASIRRLLAIEGIRFLLSSWDVPREGEEGRTALKNGLLYLQRIHQAVRQAAEGASLSPMELCGPVLKELGIAGGMANPLVARSLQSHLLAIGREDRR